MDTERRLLLVEDEEGLRELVAQFLRRACYSVIEAVDGLDGIDRFRDSGPFDLALVDLNLPGCSGVDVCREIRRLVPLQPILICSGAVLNDHLVILNELGIGTPLTKPYPPDLLLARIACELQ
jgi:DNA-binding response OmpR family regulator